MLRIVGVQKDVSADREFVLLQNQGALRVTLRGHALMSETVLETGELEGAFHAFSDDERVPAGAYVILYTGRGIPRWGRSKDGSNVYHTYMGYEDPVWSKFETPLHILNTQHTYVEQAEVLLLSS